MSKSTSKQLEECRVALEKANARADRAEQELADLREQTADSVKKFKFDGLVIHCQQQDKIIAGLRADVEQVRLYQEDAVWHWQHDGTDFLESLTCPVVIPASQLRDLMRGITTLEASDLAESLETAREQRDAEIISNQNLEQTLEEKEHRIDQLVKYGEWANPQIAVLIPGLTEALEVVGRLVKVTELEDAHLSNFGEFEAARALLARFPASVFGPEGFVV